MLNPSSPADESKNSRTMEKVRKIADIWGYGTVYVGNIYPYRSSDSSVLRGLTIPEEMMKENTKSICEMLEICEAVVYAWGTNGPLVEPVWLKEIVKDKACCIGKSAKGFPRHPLWVHDIPVKPIPFK
jgi:hypothetical protein